MEEQTNELPEPVDLNRQAMVKCSSVMGNKGWTAERKVMVIHDYLMDRRLYPDFLEFIKKAR